MALSFKEAAKCRVPIIVNVVGGSVLRVALIVNKVAGNGRCGRLYPSVDKFFRDANIEFTPMFTESRGHAVLLAKQAAQAGYGAVVSMGGDGTLNEVVNGIAGSGVVLGFIPAGSGNDFGRTVGIGSQSCDTACQVIAKGQVQEINLGQVNGRYFINIAGSGFDAEVGLTANTWGKKHFRGYMAYVASILRQLVFFTPQEVVIELDGATRKAKVWFVAIANARYFGGGLMIAPQAELHDDLFDVCIVKDVSKLELLKMIPKVFKGGHIHHPAVEMHRAAHVRVASMGRLAVQADGEVLGNLPQEFKIAPVKQKVFLP